MSEFPHDPDLGRGSPLPRGSHSRARVLIAEDDDEMRALLCEIVAERYEVTPVPDGAAALEEALADPPDLILTDITMPVLDGLALLQAVRNDPRLRTVPVVLVTGRDETLAAEGIRMGADDYLTKPFSRSELLARLTARLEIAALRREAEEARHLAGQILESITDAFFAVDAQWRFTYMNREAERLLGRKRSEVLGKELWAEFPELVNSAVHTAYHRAREERLRVSLEYFYPPLESWFDISAYPAQDGGLSVYFRDINQSVRDRRALEISEQRYRALVEISPQIVWFAQADGQVMYWNQRWFDLTGLSGEDSLGSRWGQVIHSDYRENVLALWNASAVSGASFEAEFPLRTSSGAYRWHLSRGVPTRDAEGTIVRWVGAMLDIHDRKVAEDERERVLSQLNEERLRLAAVVENVPAGIMLAIAPSGKVVLSNPQAQRILGHTSVDVSELGAYEKWVGFHPGGRRVAPDEWPLAQALKGQTVLSSDYQFESPSGDLCWLRVSAAPIRTDGGTILGAIVVFYDVDREKRAEAEREELLSALREADHRKDEFLAMLAHELRNPLAAVKNAMAVLEMPANSADRTWAGNVVQRQVGQLTHLVDDLLDVSRISQGKIRLRKEIIDAAGVIDHAVEGVYPLIANREHKFTTDYPRDGSLLVDGDATRLEQIVVNLLTNAAKYTEPGGHISVTARREDTEIVIKVADNGLGIAPEHLPQMFDLFAQGERSIARSEGGLGLGLTIVRKLTEMHGGSATAFSEGRGRGSEFCVRLPLASRLSLPPQRQDDPAPERREETAPLRILVVDDNQDTAHGLSRLLKLLGHHVEVTFDGLDAVALAERMHPDVILLDIGLPGLNGYEAAVRIRQQPWSGRTVLIAVSGYGQDEDRRKSHEAGFAHHLIKPIDYDELKVLLQRRHELARAPHVQ